MEPVVLVAGFTTQSGTSWTRYSLFMINTTGEIQYKIGIMQDTYIPLMLHMGGIRHLGRISL